MRQNAKDIQTNPVHLGPLNLIVGGEQMSSLGYVLSVFRPSCYVEVMQFAGGVTSQAGTEKGRERDSSLD